MTQKSHKFHPHVYKGRFYNHAEEKRHPFFLPSFAMIFEWYWKSIKRNECDSNFWLAPVKPLERSNELAITWIGHSTFLIQIAGANILTDPIFGNLPFFKRQIQPGLALSELPPIDYVLISHNHRDHMDKVALHYFKTHPALFMVPKGDKAWFDKRGFDNVREYTWWEQEQFTHLDNVNLSFLPAYHWSQRNIFDYNKSLWGSWMITAKNENIYFAGDTAYSHHFSAIGKEFTDISYALMPIGPCEPRKWMKYTHVSAEEAGQGFLDLNARRFIPMHWGTYSFGTDGHEAPYERIVSWWHQQKLYDTNELIVLKMGQRYTPPSESTIIVAASQLVEKQDIIY